MSPSTTILAVRDADLSPLGAVHGFQAVPEAAFLPALEAAGLWLGPRAVLETDESFRQLIPYLVLTDGRSVARYRRGRAGREGRLYGLISIGFGGHVDVGDVVSRDDGATIDLAATLARAASRELGEELGLTVPAPRWIGLLRESGTPVDRVHLGLVGLCDLDAAGLAAREAALLDLAVVETETLAAAPPATLERWSALVLAHLAG